MTFVYTGKGRHQAQKDDAPPEQKACTKQAYAIQWCLAKRDHKEELCQHVIEEWQTCFEKVRSAALAASTAAAPPLSSDLLAQTKEQRGAQTRGVNK